MIRYVRFVAVFFFGVLFPVVVLLQAHAGIRALGSDVAYTTTVNDLASHIGTASTDKWTANDYGLFSLLYVEHANQKTMINKQVMKTAIVNIGFAVMSIGLMLLVLGIDSGGAEASAAVNELEFNFKTGSTGVAIIVVGAVMSTLGGVLKNEYQTSQIPDYEHVSQRNVDPQLERSRAAYKKCAKFGAEFETCFAQAFFQINGEALK